MAKQRKAITIPSTGLTYEELKEIERTTPRSDEISTSLPIDRIFVADGVFQPRVGLEEFHVRNLAATLRDGERPFDRLLVVPIGDRHFVVDGHHRLAAYIAADWQHTIPVETFGGGLDAAEVASIGFNSKDKLPVPKSQNLEKAWKLVLRDIHSIAIIANNAMVSPRTISNMRDRQKELGEETSEYTWEEAKKGKREGGDFDVEAWVEREASEMAQRVCTVHNKDVLDSPEVFGTMIEMLNPRLIPGLLERWIEDHREALEEMLQHSSHAEALDI